jgi:hypothetical protein
MVSSEWPLLPRVEVQLKIPIVKANVAKAGMPVRGFI